MGLTCGNSSDKCFDIFVITDLILAIIGTIAFSIIYILALLGLNFIEEHPKHELADGIDPAHINSLRVVIGVMWAFVLITFLVEVYLYILGRRGIRNKHHGDCRKWFIIRIVFLVLYIVFGGFYAVSMGGGGGISLLLGCAYHIYELIVSKTFIDSLNSESTYSA